MKAFVIAFVLLSTSSVFSASVHPALLRHRKNPHSRVPKAKVIEEIEQPPPTPFKYAVEAGRHAGGKPDRYIEAEGDADGKVRGSYAYLAPNWKWQKVVYEADEENGFRILEGSTPLEAALPVDTPVVARAKEEHAAKFAEIAANNAAVVGASPPQTDAVAKKTAEHLSAFEQIAAEHARIAAELAAKRSEEERLRTYQEGIGGRFAIVHQ